MKSTFRFKDGVGVQSRYQGSSRMKQDAYAQALVQREEEKVRIKEEWSMIRKKHQEEKEREQLELKDFLEVKNQREEKAVRKI